MKTFDHILLGGNIASLVCARELTKAGCSVALVAPPDSIGGHFSPCDVLGHEYDMGMVLLEFDSYREQVTALSEYDPSILGSVGQFSDQVRNFLEPFFEIRQVKQMGVALRGQLVGDYFIANDLSNLGQVFNANETESIVDELKRCVQRDQYHPSRKSGPGVYDAISFRDASLGNHGMTLHGAMIEPLVKRATNLSSSELTGRYHRLFWAPLYYPETLLARFKEGTTLRPTEFHHPVGCSVGRLSKMLLSEIESRPGYTAVPTIESLRKSTEGWVVNDQLQTNCCLAH